ncbi:histidine ammonia-lyase [Conyzicola lurida]|uniref:Histidine ammonia-lyase n=1 Tax=Conyzicola lurida TaxID=1172621 RepID=A0A841AKE8_9MICO|nr:histidine ammonia-lyase [Conyzicola lurida]
MPILSRQAITTADVVAVSREAARVGFASILERDLQASRDVVEDVLAAGLPVYGLNTELGAGRNVVVSNDTLEEYQRRTIRNSGGGIGAPLSFEQTRAVIFARLAGFSRGGAGVTVALAAQYRELLNRDVYPLVPRTGSVGAADLTQLAAIAAVATGTGFAFVDGAVVPGADALAAVGLEPVTLQPHEAIAALSANSYSIGVASLVLDDLRGLARAADLTVALSLVALAGHGAGGNLSPFDERIQAAHAVGPQAVSAGRIRSLLASSSLAAGVTSTQDAISFRSVPQVHGSFGVAIARLSQALELELNSRTENPLVDVASQSLVSGGNFFALELALALENLRVVVGHVAAMSERRISQLSTLGVALRRSGSAVVPGLLWYSAAAELSEIRHLAGAVTLSGSSLSEGVEDHSSNAVLALQALERSVELLGSILAIEAACAVELIEVGEADAGELLAPVVADVGESLRFESPLADRVSAVLSRLVSFGR